MAIVDLSVSHTLERHGQAVLDFCTAHLVHTCLSFFQRPNQSTLLYNQAQVLASPLGQIATKRPHVIAFPLPRQTITVTE